MASSHEYDKIERILKNIADGFKVDRQLYLLAELENNGSISEEYYQKMIEKIAMTQMPFLKELLEEGES